MKRDRLDFQNIEAFLRVKRSYLVQGGVVTPHLNWYPAWGGTVRLERLAPGFGFDFIATLFVDRGDRGHWVFDEAEFIKKAELLMRHPEILEKLYRRWTYAEVKFYESIALLKHRPIQPRNFFRDYKMLHGRYLAEYTPALVTEYFTLWGNWFVRKLLKKYQTYPRAAEDIAGLTLPPYLSFMQHEEQSLTAIAHTYVDRGRADTAIHQALTEHAQAYFWIENNYKRTDPLPVAYFEKRMRELAAQSSEEALYSRLHELDYYEGETVLRKRHIRVTTKISPSDQLKLEWLAFITSWQDRRKQANLIANHWLNVYLRAAAKQLGVSLLDCQFLLPKELFQALKSRRFPGTLVSLRLRGSAHVFLGDGHSWLLSGVKYQQVFRKMLALKPQAETTVIYGLGVSPGVVRGKVMKIQDPKKVRLHFKKGAILVAYMTRPDFLPLMRFAQAIVTDEGGVTSHAAVVARELKIPCVVGTKIAMRVLKDGDLVEVDAIKGIVKKL